MSSKTVRREISDNVGCILLVAILAGCYTAMKIAGVW